jgi:hypothetical protein
LDAS